jgi:hypothetical protein
MLSSTENPNQDHRTNLWFKTQAQYRTAGKTYPNPNGLIIVIIVIITTNTATIIITASFVIVIRVIPVARVMALRTLGIAVLPRPVAIMTGLTIRLVIMVKLGALPTLGIMTLGTLPAKMA